MGVGGEQQTNGSLTYNNTIFPNDQEGVGGSIAGIDQQGFEFATGTTDYNLYSNNGFLFDGVNTAPLGLNDSAFYVDGSQGVDTLVGTGPVTSSTPVSRPAAVT